MAAFTGLACHTIYVDMNACLLALPAPLLDCFRKWERDGRVYVQPAGWMSFDTTLLGLTLESALESSGQPMKALHPLLHMRERGGMKSLFGRTKTRMFEQVRLVLI